MTKEQKKWYDELTAKEYLSELGRIRGSVKSEKKAKQSAANGMKHVGKKNATKE